MRFLCGYSLAFSGFMQIAFQNSNSRAAFCYSAVCTCMFLFSIETIYLGQVKISGAHGREYTQRLCVLTTRDSMELRLWRSRALHWGSLASIYWQR